VTTLSDVCAEITRGAKEHLARTAESCVIVGVTVDGERTILSFRSEGAELVVSPAADSIFEIGSVSKTFLGTVLAVLDQRGVVSIEDPIAKHLPNGADLRPEIGALTIRQLATHTAGLEGTGHIHQGFLQEEIRGSSLPPLGITTHWVRYRKEHLYRDLETAVQLHSAGEGWFYSPMGMGTVGHILELATGQDYESLVREIVCEPLGLVDTAYTLSTEQQSRMVQAFFPHGQPAPPWYWDVMLSQGGLRSTMNDMLTFAEANMRAGRGEGDTALANGMRHARGLHLSLPKPQGDDDDLSFWKTEIRHGLAWKHFEAPLDRASTHTGVTPFTHSFIAVDDASQVGCVLLSSAYDNFYFMEPFSTIFGYAPIAPRFLSWFKAACEVTK
jgi:CubicO group peptidase (beta-lactamase class C family)